MHQSLGSLGRIVTRSIYNGIVSSGRLSVEDAKVSELKNGGTKLITAVSGFPKQACGYNIETIIKGQIGDDAYFIAKHVDDWSKDEHVADQSNSRAQSRDKMLGMDVIGVADGVGGWRQHGIDPGLFSKHLMKSCEQLIKSGCFTSNKPDGLLACGFKELKEYKRQIVGSSTACVMVFCHSDLKLYTANIGDSGFLVVRDGKVVHRSTEQVHYFNTPFQLSLPPSGMDGVLRDSPESADSYEFRVLNGDVILLATDGIFDNVPDSLLVTQMSQLCGCDDGPTVQQCANSIALMARKLSQDENYLSPFTIRARQHGFDCCGGKVDDITVLLATVVIPQ